MRSWGVKRKVEGHWLVPSRILNLQSIVRHSSAPPSQSKDGGKKGPDKDTKRTKREAKIQVCTRCCEQYPKNYHGFLAALAHWQELTQKFTRFCSQLQLAVNGECVQDVKCSSMSNILSINIQSIWICILQFLVNASSPRMVLGTSFLHKIGLMDLL